MFGKIACHSLGIKTSVVKSVCFDFDANLVEWLRDGFPDVIINILLDFVGLISEAEIKFQRSANLGFLWLHQTETSTDKTAHDPMAMLRSALDTSMTPPGRRPIDKIHISAIIDPEFIVKFV